MIEIGLFLVLAVVFAISILLVLKVMVQVPGGAESVVGVGWVASIGIFTYIAADMTTTPLAAMVLVFVATDIMFGIFAFANYLNKGK